MYNEPSSHLKEAPFSPFPGQRLKGNHGGLSGQCDPLLHGVGGEEETGGSSASGGAMLQLNPLALEFVPLHPASAQPAERGSAVAQAEAADAERVKARAHSSRNSGSRISDFGGNVGDDVSFQEPEPLLNQAEPGDNDAPGFITAPFIPSHQGPGIGAGVRPGYSGPTSKGKGRAHRGRGRAGSNTNGGGLAAAFRATGSSHGVRSSQPRDIPHSLSRNGDDYGMQDTTSRSFFGRSDAEPGAAVGASAVGIGVQAESAATSSRNNRAVHNGSSAVRLQSSEAGSLESSGYSGTTPPGRKGHTQNANHLLNFRYESFQQQRASSSRGRGGTQRRQWRPPTPFNKELFLQANFRFLVSDLGDYGLHMLDPDRTLDWQQVAAVEVEEAVLPQCPICLEAPPLCPQITACGHMFCFPCIVRYLAIGEEDRKEHWKKCPLCFAMIGTRDLRSAKVHVATLLKRGEKLHFSLLVRSKGSIIPFDRRHFSNSSSGLQALPYSQDGRCHPFAKFTLTSSDGVEAAVKAMEAELMDSAGKAQASGHREDIERVPYFLLAVDLLQERKQAWVKHRATDFMGSSPPVQKRIMGQAKLGFADLVDKPVMDAGEKRSGDIRKGEVGPASKPMGGLPSARGHADKKLVDVAAETEAAMSKLKDQSSWVYESAFTDSDDGETRKNIPSQGRRTKANERGKIGAGQNRKMDARVESSSEKGNDGTSRSAVTISGRGGSQNSSTEGVMAGGLKHVGGDEKLGNGVGGRNRDNSEATGLEGANASREAERKGLQVVKMSNENLLLDSVVERNTDVSGKEGGDKEGGEEGQKKSAVPSRELEEKGYYMFYQAEDGRPLILHTLSMKCLLQHYGSYEALPETLEASVLEVTAETQSESTRKRYRFLSHLPLTATFYLVEVDVSDLVPPSATAPFAEELRQRENRRQRKIKQDIEDKAKLEREAASFVRGPQLPTPEDFAAMLSAASGDEPVDSFVFTDHSQQDWSPPSSLTPSGIYPLDRTNSVGVTSTPGQEKLLFSRVAEMGYASGLNAPELPPRWDSGDTAGVSNAWNMTSTFSSGSPSAQSAWGPLSGGGVEGHQSNRRHQSFAGIIQSQKTEVAEEAASSSGRTVKKKGKKGMTVLLTTNVRRN